MQVFANRNPRAISFPTVYVALEAYAGSAGRWGKGDAVIIPDPQYAAWLMREAQLAPATLTPAQSPVSPPVRPVRPTGDTEMPPAPEIAPEVAPVAAEGDEQATAGRKGGRGKASTGISEGGEA